MLATLALALLTPSAPVDTKSCVEKGLKWLTGRQQADGSWTGSNNRNPTTVTALAGLALLMEGSTLKQGIYSAELRKAVAWLEKNAAASGQLATAPGETARFAHGHAYALLFLASAYDTDDAPTRREQLAALIANAVAFSVDAQSKRGGWGEFAVRARPDGDDTQSTFLMLQALLAVRGVGVAVPQSATDAASHFLVRATNPTTGTVASRLVDEGTTFGTTQTQFTAGALAAHLMRDGPRPQVLARWVGGLKTTTIGRSSSTVSGALAAHFQMARTAFALGDAGHRKLDPAARDADLVRWSAYKATTYEKLVDEQFPDGNWADPTSGTVFATSFALIILQLENGYLPALAR